jgi:serine/threonine protein kinase
MRYQFDMLSYLQKKGICEKYFICPVMKYRTKNPSKYYILFDYLDGYSTLDNLMTKETMANKVIMAKHLIKIVKILHDNKIVHHDIKLNNIMGDPKTLDVRLIDFGTAIINTYEVLYSSTRGFNHYVIAPGFKINGKETFNRFEKNDFWALGNAIWKFCYNIYPNLKSASARKKANETLQKLLKTKQKFFYDELA